jgi:5-methylcytosine-specific restriction endonuclease McrA
MVEKASSNRSAQRFEANFLADRSQEGLLKELRRVAGLTHGRPLTKKIFDEHAKVSTNVLCRTFGGWAAALRAAGLDVRVSKVNVTAKMREQSGRRATDQELIEAIQAVARNLGKTSITVNEFNDGSSFSAAVLRSRFGSWPKALNIAGLSTTKSGKRYSDLECFENLANVWSHYGRQPQHDDMRWPPSIVGSKAYVSRWKTWRGAILAFVQWANDDKVLQAEIATSNDVKPTRVQRKTAQPERDQRRVPLRLQFKVFHRDSFRCVACGRSPATHLGTVLHADHIIPWVKGGKTEITNLQTLCGHCNLGKGDWTPEPETEFPAFKMV